MVEFVWDTGRTGTATGTAGASLSVGDQPSGYSPDDLVAMAAAGCLMRAFLSAADRAGVPILAYMATADLRSANHSPDPRLHVRSFVVGSEALTEERLADLAAEATRTSRVARLFGDRCVTEWELRALHGA
jgi:uncharacterized OsmC-like protein